MLQDADELRIVQVTPYLLDEPSPNSLCVGGLANAEFDIQFRGDGGTLIGDQYDIVVEAALQKNPDIQWQRVLRKLLAPTGSTSIRAAIEANKLTSRMDDEGAVTTGHDPACDDLHVTGFRGQTTYMTPGGIEVALAEWTVQVLT